MVKGQDCLPGNLEHHFVWGMLYYVVEIDIGTVFIPSMGKMAVSQAATQYNYVGLLDKVKQTHFLTPRSVENLRSAETREKMDLGLPIRSTSLSKSSVLITRSTCCVCARNVHCVYQLVCFDHKKALLPLLVKGFRMNVL